jgi:glutamine---fructose-6-phosphate transaminase (isomerizing)
MCGIVGYIGPRDAAPILMQGLQRLEYRGYDSAGIAVARSGKLRLHKSKGKVRELESRLPDKLRGGPGIAHTRWATHGEPSDRNAHPHCDAANRYAIVHNGIIENAVELRARLEAQGVVFQW